MKILILGIAFAAGCFAQGKQAIAHTGTVDDSGLTKYTPPLKTVATLPAAASNTNAVFIVTDGASASDCTVGGSSTRAICISNGSAWVTMGGGGSTTTNPFPSGTKLANPMPCAYGTITAATLAGLSSGASKELTIQAAVSGDVRYDHIQLSETAVFAGTTGLTVAMGLTGSNSLILSGVAFPLMVSSGDASFWNARPVPPALTGTYDIVLTFAVTSGNVNAATDGTLTWEVCGYVAR